MTSSILATKPALASGAITHCCLRCGLRMFLSVRPMVLSLAFRRCSVRRLSLQAGSESIWRSPPEQATGQRDQLCFRGAVKNPGTGRGSDCICASAPPRSLLHQLPSCSLDKWRRWCPEPRRSGRRSSLRPPPRLAPSQCAPSSSILRCPISRPDQGRKLIATPLR